MCLSDGQPKGCPGRRAMMANFSKTIHGPWFLIISKEKTIGKVIISFGLKQNAALLECLNVSKGRFSSRCFLYLYSKLHILYSVQLILLSSIIYYVGMLFITDAVFFLYKDNTSEDNKL